jgi:hypothetical protein
MRADTIVVLANALATRIAWAERFELVDSGRLGGEWASQVDRALEAPRQHRMYIASTSQAGLVGVHAADSVDGLLVVSVIADRSVEPAAVHAAAHDVAIMLARSMSQALLVAPSTARPQSLFALPLGEGHAWTITEETVVADPAGPLELLAATLPAWQTTAQHDLLDPKLALGFEEAGNAVAALCNPEFGPIALEAVQVASGSFSRIGFEAAAITAAMHTRSARPRRAEVRRRNAHLRFNRPYAVVAVTVDRPQLPGSETSSRSPAWHGVPVFSAWINEPAEPTA